MGHTADTALYWQHAQAVLKTGDYGPADYPPGYPYMLAALGTVIGDITLDLAAAYSVILSAMTCALVYLMGRELFDEQVGWVAGWYTVFYDFWSPFDRIFYQGVTAGVVYRWLVYGALLVPFTLGIIEIVSRRLAGTYYSLAVIAAVMSIHTLTYSEERYRIPVAPFYILVALAWLTPRVAHIWETLRKPMPKRDLGGVSLYDIDSTQF